MRSNLYEILELLPSASETEIRRAYRRLAVQYHPDHKVTEGCADKQFSDIIRAYNVLSERESRKRYDQALMNETIPVINTHYSPMVQTAERIESRGVSKFSQIKETAFARTRQQSMSYDLPFFQSKQAYYIFFNTHDDAASFRPLKQVHAPVFTYITPASLAMLCSRVSKTAEEKPIFHQRGKDHPAHVVVKTNYSPRMENFIDTLIHEMVLLELIGEPIVNDDAISSRHNAPLFV